MANKEKTGHISRIGVYLLVLMILTSMLSLTACEDPMESEIMQDPTFVELLKIFGYKPPEEWIVPCEYTRITSPFGYREHPVTGKWGGHTGIDMAAPKNTPIYASRSGVVVFAGWDSSGGGGGNYVSIEHENGFKSQYMHMTEFVVEKGQHVRQGQLIGYVGDTGVTTGYHLHFTIRKYDSETKEWIPVDPAQYIHID